MTRAPKDKLALGTVQLGLPYGSNNKTGKPDLEASFQILDSALRHGIHILDSADAYGDSSQVIGSYLNARPSAKFKIISKFTDDGRPIAEKLSHSLTLLSCDQLYGYMYHRFDDYQANKYRNELLELRKDAKILKIGVSIYSLKELETVVSDSEISLIQIPVNPFDASPEKLALLTKAKSSGKEIHVRSIFLQGLFFKKPEELTGNLKQLREPLMAFQKILASHGLDVRQGCLNFALHLPMVDFVVIGVDTSEQLVQNIEALLPDFSSALIQDLQSIEITERSILNPSNWKP